MGYRSAAFYRKLDGYTNGYWLPGSHEFASTCNYSYSTWNKGSAQEFSYIDGATDRHGVKNVFSLFTYTFYRLGVEPEKIEKYIPDYWDAIEPIKGEYLNYLEYIPIEEEKEEEPIIPTEEVKPEEPIQEEEEKEEIPNEAPKTRTPVQTPQSVEPIPEAPAAAVTTTLVESVPVENSTPILEATPDEPIIEIDVTPVPLSTPETSYWALVNLICSIIVAIEAIILFIFFFIKRKVKEDKENTSIILTKSFVKRLVSIFIAVISFILFFLTEDMTLPMRYVDKYTILMILLIILQTAIMAFWKRNKSEKN